MIEGFNIIGIWVRSTNQNNKAATDLGNLWQRISTENVIEKIQNKLSCDILCIYTDYESDFTGAYTAIIGVRVSNLVEIPKGMIGREFAAENFKLFTAEGEMPAAVVTTWNEIWRNDKQVNRKYNYDFEVYGEDAQKGENSKVAIYVSVA